MLRALSQSMYGAWRLARLDPAAMALFEPGVAGAKRSFWAGLICYPAYLLLIAWRVEPAQWASSGALRILSVESIGYVVGWTAFPLVILYFCRWLERDEQSLEFITAYNWSQVLQTVLTIAGLLAVRALPPAAASLLYLAILMAQLGYEWFIARTALEAGGVAAAVVVLIDLVLGEAVNQITQSLY